METKRGFGWLPDIPSVKDYTESTPEIRAMLSKTKLAYRVDGTAKGSAAAAADRPAKVDLRSGFSPVEDQQRLGSCTANAAVGLLEFYEKKAHGKYVDASRLFVYKVSRNLLGWTGDTGAYLRTALGALALFGAPPERYWPYDGDEEKTNKKFDQEPPAFCYAFAANFNALRYYRLDTADTTAGELLNKVRSYLAKGSPSMFGFPVYNEFMEPNAQGHVAYPAATSTMYGGHAIVACGYDDNLTINGDKGAFLIRNSWGTGWGDNGYAWMSNRYITEGLAVDWWSILKSEWVDTNNF